MLSWTGRNQQAIDAIWGRQASMVRPLHAVIAGPFALAEADSWHLSHLGPVYGSAGPFVRAIEEGSR